MKSNTIIFLTRNGTIHTPEDYESLGNRINEAVIRKDSFIMMNQVFRKNEVIKDVTVNINHIVKFYPRIGED